MRAKYLKRAQNERKKWFLTRSPLVPPRHLLRLHSFLDMQTQWKCSIVGG